MLWNADVRFAPQQRTFTKAAITSAM